MVGRAAADWWTRNGHSPATLDRILIGLCALIWLVLLGFSVAAVVALVDLGQGFHKPTGNPHTGLLYIVIGVSALIILVAIPILVRARQATPRRPAARPAGFPQFGDAPPVRPGQRMPQPGFHDPARRGTAARAIMLSHGEVDRVLLRGITELTSVIGTALTAVAAATYLMAVGKDTAAWVGYGVAGFITATMPLIPWLQLRQLRGLLA